MFLVLAVNSFSYDVWSGVEKGKLTVCGNTYEFPIVDEKGKGPAISKNDLYYLKKAMNGDRDAMELILSGKDERWFFIGMDTPIWLKIYKGTFQVVKP